MELLERISDELEKGNSEEVCKLTREALEADIPPPKILSDGLALGMGVVGEKFRIQEFSIPEVLIAAEAMKAGMDVLRPKLIASGTKLVGKVVLGTVEGDIHDIGKNLVGMFVEGAGYQVIDLGIDVPLEKFLEAVRAHRPNILGLSTLLTTEMPRMKEIVESLVEAGIRDTVKVMVGGAPLTEHFAKMIGADGYAPDAPRAVTKANQLLS